MDAAALHEASVASKNAAIEAGSGTGIAANETASDGDVIYHKLNYRDGSAEPVGPFLSASGVKGKPVIWSEIQSSPRMLGARHDQIDGGARLQRVQ